MRMASEKGEEEDPNNGADSISMADGRRGRREGEGRYALRALLRPLGQRDGDDFPPLAAQ